jgi:membrane-associated phospholipid phosphatase
MLDISRNAAHRRNGSALPIGARANFDSRVIRTNGKVLMRTVFFWLMSLTAIVILIAVSYQWLDRPIALLVHREARLSHFGLWVWLTRIPNPLPPLALVVFVIFGLLALARRSLSKFQSAGLVCSLSVIIAEVTKNQLKVLFGRAWPETWAGNNPSFIRDGDYGFHFLHGGGAYNAFPSGHMATTCAMLSVLWFSYPRPRWLYAMAGLMVGAGLVVANYHFLSDVIAGAFLGGSIGCLATAIWRLADPTTVPVQHTDDIKY